MRVVDGSSIGRGGSHSHSSQMRSPATEFPQRLAEMWDISGPVQGEPCIRRSTTFDFGGRVQLGKPGEWHQATIIDAHPRHPMRALGVADICRPAIRFHRQESGEVDCLSLGPDLFGLGAQEAICVFQHESRFPAHSATRSAGRADRECPDAARRPQAANSD